MSQLREPLLPFSIKGHIVSVQGSTILASFPRAAVGDLCWLCDRHGEQVLGEVTSFNETTFSLSLFESPVGIFPGMPVYTRSAPLAIPVGKELLGRVINPLGNPIDARPSIRNAGARRSIHNRPPQASTRPRIDTPLETGVRAIDGFCTLGYGQRIGVFASAGMGKSTLLGMIARRAAVDIIVVALVGERGREVREFLEETLGEEGLRRAVVVVATSDDSSLLRQTAPYTATTIAEYFRDEGLNVLLIIDSLTRMARAVRETSIAAGDLPVRHGYTNTVYTQLPKLLERAGRSGNGSITAIYTLLTNQEDDIDPLADEVKSLLDGHLVLRKELAHLGVLPSIDVTHSISRLFRALTTEGHQQRAGDVSRALARLIKERHIALLGGVPDPELQRILECRPEIIATMSQKIDETTPMEDTRRLIALASSALAL